MDKGVKCVDLVWRDSQLVSALLSAANMAEYSGVANITAVLEGIENTLELTDTIGPISLFEDFASNMEVNKRSNDEQIESYKASGAERFKKKMKMAKPFDQTSKNETIDNLNFFDNEDTTEMHLKNKLPKSQQAHSLDNNPDKFAQKTKEDIKENKTMKSKKEFTCDDCGISFKLSTTLENHQMKYQCGLNEESLKLLGNIETSSNSCVLCGVSASNMQQLQKHQCHVLPILKCDLCSYSTRTTHLMLQHKSFKHLAPLKCTLCEYEYKKQTMNPAAASAAIRYHMEGKHSKTNFECFDCGEKVVSKEKLEYHFKTKHVKYQCEQCNKNESSEYRLKQHIMKIHEQIQLLCPMCDFKAKSKYMISKHQNQTHLKNETFSCNFCGFKGQSEYLLQKHKKTNH